MCVLETQQIQIETVHIGVSQTQCNHPDSLVLWQYLEREVSEFSRRYIFKKKTNCHSVPVQSYCGAILLCSIIWPWIAWQQLYQQPYHTQSCCAGRTEEWWRLGRRRQWKSSYSRLEQSIWRGRQKQYRYVMWGCLHARCDFWWIIFKKINK